MNGAARPAGRHHRVRSGDAVLTRRSVLIGSGAVILAAGGGVAAGLLRPVHTYRPPDPPRQLHDALRAEDQLIAGLDAALRARAAEDELLAQLRADHVEHRRAIEGAIGAITRWPAPSTSATTPAPERARAPARSALLRAEQEAARTAAARAAHLRGAPATLLAAVAACEASHAELLQ